MTYADVADAIRAHLKELNQASAGMRVAKGRVVASRPLDPPPPPEPMRFKMRMNTMKKREGPLPDSTKYKFEFNLNRSFPDAP